MNVSLKFVPKGKIINIPVLVQPVRPPLILFSNFVETLGSGDKIEVHKMCHIIIMLNDLKTNLFMIKVKWIVVFSVFKNGVSGFLCVNKAINVHMFCNVIPYNNSQVTYGHIFHHPLLLEYWINRLALSCDHEHYHFNIHIVKCFWKSSSRTYTPAS